MVLAHKLYNPSQKYDLDLDKKELENSHLLFSGGSGSGKTYNLKRVMSELAKKQKVLVVIDYHGDLKTVGENLIKFSYANDTHAINPFELELDVEQGGVKTQAEVVLRILGTYFFTKGRITKKQENLLEEIILDTYATKGIIQDDISTWNKPVPTMKDLGKVFEYIMRRAEGKVEADEADDAEENVLMSIKSSLNAIKKIVTDFKAIKGTPLQTEMIEHLKVLKEKTDGIIMDEVELEKGEISNMDFSKIKIDYYLQQGNIKSFMNLYNYVYKVANINFFGSNLPKLKRGINRIDLSAFTSIGKPLIAKLISELLMQKFFRSAMVRGEYKFSKQYIPGTKFDRVIVIDESKIAMPSGVEKNDHFNIINRIVTESRKFGLAIILASQRIDHYSDEMLSNISTKIILGAKAIDYNRISKAIGIKQNIIQNAFSIRDKRVAIISEDGRSDIWEMEEIRN